MRAWWWEPGGDRGIERLWRFVHTDAVEPFGAPSSRPGSPLDRLRAVLKALDACGLRYVFEPAFQRGGVAGQYLRDPEMVWRTREGTCIDLCLVVAGALLRAGLRCWIVVGRSPGQGAGHAWVVVDVGGDDRSFPAHRALVAGVGSVGSWESVVSGAAVPAGWGVGLVEDGVELARFVRDEPQRFVVVNAAGLAAGYPDRFPEGALLGRQSAHGLLDHYEQQWVCDVGWWWHDDLIEPLPERRDPRSLLQPLWAAPPGQSGPWGAGGLGGGVGSLFLADRRVVPFVASDPFDRVCNRAALWHSALLRRRDRAAGVEQMAWVLLLGRGGAGKTRTALEVAERLAGDDGVLDRHGLTGVVPRDADDGAVEELASQPGLSVLVVDYAETFGRDKVALLQRCLAARPPGWGQVVLIVTGRERGEWADDVARHLGDPLVAEVLDEAGDVLDVERLFVDALHRLAALLQVPEPGWPAVLDLGGTTPLEVILRAGLLLAARDEAGRAEVAVAGTEELYRSALAHERRYWRELVESSRGAGWSEGLGADIQDLLAVVSVVQPSVADVRLLAERAGLCADAVGVVTRLYADSATASATTPGGRRLLGLQPDPLADHLIAATLNEDNTAWDRIAAFADATDGWNRAFEVLDRSLHRAPIGASDEIAQYLTDRPDLIPAAVPSGAASDSCIRRALVALATLPSIPAELQCVAESDDPGLADVRLALTASAVMRCRDGVAGANDRHRLAPRIELASLLSDLAVCQREVGADADAVASASEAVEILIGEVDTENFGEIGPVWASSMTILSTGLADVGEHGPALEAARLAVNIAMACRDQSSASPEILAGCLNNLGVRLVEVADESSIEDLQFAVRLFGDLAARSEHFADDLGMALSNLSVAWSRFGDSRQAASVGTEAVRVLEECVDQGSQPLMLATALHNLALDLIELDREDEAMDAVDEACAIRRSVRRSDSRRVVDLSNSLWAAGWIRLRSGRTEDATNLLWEGLEILECEAGNRVEVVRAKCHLGIAQLYMTIRDHQRLEQHCEEAARCTARIEPLGDAAVMLLADSLYLRWCSRVMTQQGPALLEEINMIAGLATSEGTSHARSAYLADKLERMSRIALMTGERDAEDRAATSANALRRSERDGVILGNDRREGVIAAGWRRIRRRGS